MSLTPRHLRPLVLHRNGAQGMSGTKVFKEIRTEGYMPTGPDRLHNLCAGYNFTDTMAME